MRKLWTQFWRQPHILKVAVLMVLIALGVPLAVSAQDEPEGVEIPVRGICRDGRLAEIRLFAPRPGPITIQIPPNACAGAPSSAPQPPKRPGVTT